MRWGSQSNVNRFPGGLFGFRKTFRNPLAAGVLRVGFRQAHARNDVGASG